MAYIQEQKEPVTNSYILTISVNRAGSSNMAHILGQEGLVTNSYILTVSVNRARLGKYGPHPEMGKTGHN